MDYARVHGIKNVGDLMTKALNKDMSDNFCYEIGVEFPQGADDIALSIRGLEQGPILKAAAGVLAVPQSRKLIALIFYRLPLWLCVAL